MNRNVAITGASGYIARYLTDELKKIGTDKLFLFSSKINSDYTLYDPMSVKSWLEIVENCNVIFHLAGDTNLDHAEDNPTKGLLDSIIPFQNLIKACKILNKNPSVIYASTATVYGDYYNHHVTEYSLPMPLTHYDINKLYIENYLSYASRLGILKGASLRFSNIYGLKSLDDNNSSRGVLNRMISSAYKGIDLICYNGGDFYRDCIYIDDVIDIVIRLSHKKDLKGDIYNVCNGTSYKFKDMLFLIKETVNKRYGTSIKIEFREFNDRFIKLNTRNFFGDPGKVCNDLNIISFVNFELGLHQTLDLLDSKKNGKY